jgi:hypothetical protein
MLAYTSNSDAQLEASSNNERLPFSNDVEASRVKLQRTGHPLFSTTPPRVSLESCAKPRQGSEALQYELQPGLDAECITLSRLRTV